MNLIVCSEKCVYQQDGYCVLEHPRAIANPKGPAENRCIYLKASGSSGEDPGSFWGRHPSQGN